VIEVSFFFAKLFALDRAKWRFPAGGGNIPIMTDINREGKNVYVIINLNSFLDTNDIPPPTIK